VDAHGFVMKIATERLELGDEGNEETPIELGRPPSATAARTGGKAVDLV
jgi:hypothetical protein